MTIDEVKERHRHALNLGYHVQESRNGKCYVINDDRECVSSVGFSSALSAWEWAEEQAACGIPARPLGSLYTREPL